MAGPASSKPKGQKLAKLYLLAYNVIQTIGWSLMLWQVAQHYIGRSTGSLWDSVFWSVMIFQNAAVLEVMHAGMGLVPSNAMVTLMQVFSRVFIVLAVLLVTKAAPAGWGLPVSLLAWGLTEVVRYSYYALHLLGAVPPALTFLRYSLYIALYPFGITGELLCLYDAQNEVASTDMWSVAMPNWHNSVFNYRYFLIAYMLLYIPLFPVMYGHMHNQRKKMLGLPAQKAK